MHSVVKNLIDLNKEVKKKIEDLNFKSYNPKIIAVSKTFSINTIYPLLEYGHLHFGENKVQEAILKWSNIKEKYQNIKLHMIGGLQTNKVKQAVGLFDFIHSVDSLKLAKKIADEQAKKKKSLKIFLQVNIGKEMQKNGISLDDVSHLAEDCKGMNLDVVGLMCIPPINEQTSDFFSKIKLKNDELEFNELSLGMSNDYTEALSYKSTYIRIGTKIFGRRG